METDGKYHHSSNRPRPLYNRMVLNFLLVLAIFAGGGACSGETDVRAAFRGDTPLKFNRTSVELSENSIQSISLSLVSKPDGEVQVPLVSDDTTELQIDPPRLVFTPGNYKVPQTIRLVAPNDCETDGRQNTRLRVEKIESSDSRYKNQTLTIPVTIDDSQDSKPNIIFLYEDSLDTSEAGTADFFRVNISCPPEAPVKVPLKAEPAGEVFLDKNELLFTPENYQDYQLVTVTGLSDCQSDGDQDYQIQTTNVTSDDERFNRYHDSAPLDNSGETRLTTTVSGTNSDQVVQPGLAVEAPPDGIALDLDYSASVHPDAFIVLKLSLTCPLPDENPVYFSFDFTDDFARVANSPDGHQFLTFNQENYYQPQSVLIGLNTAVATGAGFFTSPPYYITIYQSENQDINAPAISEPLFTSRDLEVEIHAQP